VENYFAKKLKYLMLILPILIQLSIILIMDHITLNVRGTIIAMPRDILEKSAIIKKLYNKELFQKIPFTNCNPQYIHKILDDIYGSEEYNLDDDEKEDISEKENYNDKCELKWKSTTFIYLPLQINCIDIIFNLEPGTFAAGKIEMKFNFKYYDSDNYIKYHINADEYYLIQNSMETYWCEIDGSKKILNIDVQAIIQALEKLKNISISTYIKKNNLCSVNKKIKETDPNYLGHIVFGFSGSIIHGEVIQNIMREYEKELIEIIETTLHIFDRMIKMLDNVVCENKS
jgi:hypothetical protein